MQFMNALLQMESLKLERAETERTTETVPLWRTGETFIITLSWDVIQLPAEGHNEDFKGQNYSKFYLRHL